MADPVAALPPGFKIDTPDPVQSLPPGFKIDAAEPSAQPVAQMQGVGREIALPASSFAKGALSAVGLPGDLLRSAVHLYSKYIGTPLADLASPITGEPGHVLSGHNPLDSQTLIDSARTLGAVDRPDLQPQNERERLEAAAAQGAGAVLPLAATGGAAALPRALAQGAGAGVGSELGKELVPNHPIAAPLIGGLVGGGAGSLGYTGAAKVANAAKGTVSPVVEAYDRLGIDPKLVGDVTGSPGLQQIQAFAAKAPGSAGKIEQAGEHVVSQFDNAVDRTASNLGVSRTASQAGQTLQAEARNWRDNVFPQREAEAWAPVDKMVSPWAAVQPENYRTALAALSSKLAALPETKKVLLSDRAQSLLKAINADVPEGAGMTWQDAQNLRSIIGEIRGVPEIASSLGEKQLGRMYGALSEDMMNTAERYGAGDAFTNANAVSTQGHSFIRNVLSKIIKSNNPMQESIRPEQAASNALNGGDTTLQAIRQELPNAADELGAYKLRDMALANPGQQMKVGGNSTSPATFLTDLNKLRQSSPEGVKALFDADPHTSQAVKDLETVAGTIKKTAQRLNTSNTGPHNQIAGIIAGSVPTAILGHEYGGVPGAASALAAEVGVPLGLGALAGRLSTNEKLARLLSTPVQPPAMPLTRIAPIAGSVPALLPPSPVPAIPRR